MTNTNQYAKLSPEQFNMLVTKNDLDEKMKEIATKKDIQKVLDAADEINKKFTNHEVEHVANLGAHKRIDKKIEKIEKHIGLKTAEVEL